MFNAVIDALKELGGSGSNQEIFDKVVELEKFPDEVLDVLHNDGPMTSLEYRLRWTQTYLKKDGLIDNVRRGVWALTSAGRTAEKAAIEGIVDRVRAQYKKRRNEKDAILAQDSEILEELDWNVELLSILREMPPDSFERLCQRILRESGFVQVKVTGGSGDGGIDGVGVLRMQLVSFQVMFQCKRYKGTVSPSTVRDFRGAMMGRADKGLIWIGLTRAS